MFCLSPGRSVAWSICCRGSASAKTDPHAGDSYVESLSQGLRFAELPGAIDKAEPREFRQPVEEDVGDNAELVDGVHHVEGSLSYGLRDL